MRVLEKLVFLLLLISLLLLFLGRFARSCFHLNDIVARSDLSLRPLNVDLVFVPRDCTILLSKAAIHM